MSTSEHYVDGDFDDKAYGLIDLGDASPDKCRERWLFLWVIIQALVDIGMIKPFTSGRRAMVLGDTHKAYVRSAINWLLHDKQDFSLVCDLAGIEPFIIRSQVRRFMQRVRAA